MAKTSKRQREIARRRVERQMQRRMQARARARRRATVIGASVAAAAVIAAIVGVSLALSGGSPKKNDHVAVKPPPTPTPAATPTALAAPPKKCAPIKPNPPSKGDPFVPPVKGKAPTKLVITDIKVGHGKAAKKGASLSVRYTGISCSTGKQFDASALHGNTPFTVAPLGTAQVIPGWNEGLIGVKAGGERELIIPASLGYGPNGSGPIKGNETLIFVVDVLSVK